MADQTAECLSALLIMFRDDDEPPPVRVKGKPKDVRTWTLGDITLRVRTSARHTDTGSYSIALILGEETIAKCYTISADILEVDRKFNTMRDLIRMAFQGKEE